MDEHFRIVDFAFRRHTRLTAIHRLLIACGFEVAETSILAPRLDPGGSAALSHSQTRPSVHRHCRYRRHPSENRCRHPCRAEQICPIRYVREFQLLDNHREVRHHQACRDGSDTYLRHNRWVD